MLRTASVSIEAIHKSVQHDYFYQTQEKRLPEIQQFLHRTHNWPGVVRFLIAYCNSKAKLLYRATETSVLAVT